MSAHSSSCRPLVGPLMQKPRSSVGNSKIRVNMLLTVSDILSSSDTSRTSLRSQLLSCSVLTFEPLLPFVEAAMVGALTDAVVDDSTSTGSGVVVVVLGVLISEMCSAT